MKFTLLITVIMFPILVTAGTVDTIPPTINCPEAITQSMPFGQSFAPVLWTIPTTSDNSGLAPTVTANPSLTPGQQFQLGTTTITYTATGAASNSASCTFTVTLTQEDKPQDTNVLICNTTDNRCLVYASMSLGLLVVILLAIVFCVLYIRARRMLHDGASRSMISLHPVHQCNSIAANDSGISKGNPKIGTAQKQLPTETEYLTPSTPQPPIPPPKPDYLQDHAMENAYDYIDNYGYMCFEVKN